jgi:nucleotide-binding universal stress UspA family protein
MFEKILVAVDESEQAKWALQTAINIAKVLKGELTLVHVVKATSDRVQHDENQKSQELLEKFQSTIPASVKTQIDSRNGNVVAEIVAAAEEIKAGLIVMGTHGQGRLTQLLLGSTTEGVARWAPCPVLTVRQPCNSQVSVSPFRRILIAVDASEPALAALAAGVEMANETGAAMAVIHVADTVHPWQGELNELGMAPLSKIRRQGQLLLNRILADQPGTENCQKILRDGQPASEILETASDWKADLIVIGSQGHGHFEQFVLGSVANAVVRGASCPVMLVRPEAVIAPQTNFRTSHMFPARPL